MAKREEIMEPLCVKEYAAKWRMSESTVRKWIARGILKVEQPAGKGGSIRIVGR